jgi:hypothetical protein
MPRIPGRPRNAVTASAGMAPAAVRRALLLGLCGAVLAACGTSAPPTHFDSMAGYNRTFDAALGAMADQKMVFSVQDRRNGRIIGEVGGETLTATLQPMPDGALRVSFVPQNDSPAAMALQQRVADSYSARMSGQSILGGFRDSGDQRGPAPCPAGPAFCN